MKKTFKIIAFVMALGIVSSFTLCCKQNSIPSAELGSKNSNEILDSNDRDDYLDISADKLKDSTNYGIIPKEVSTSWWGTKAIKIGRWTIKIPYLYWGTSTYSITKGAFDFDSIMLYDGFPVKQNKQYLNNGKPNTKRNYTLSYYDILMIKNQY